MSEFARPLRLDETGATPVVRGIEAGVDERLAISARLGLLSLDQLAARFRAWRVAGGLAVEGEVEADAAQACGLTGLPVPARVREPVAVRFIAEALPAGDEIELEASQLDTLPLEGGSVDLGELAVQTLALALPAFPRAEGPEAEAARAHLLTEEEAAALSEADRRAASPFARLARGE